MSTPKQRLVEKLAFEHPNWSKGKTLREAGYTKKTSEAKPSLYDHAIKAVTKEKAETYLAIHKEQRSLKSEEEKQKAIEVITEGIPQPEARDLFVKLGVRPETIIERLVKMITQDRDNKAALTAMTPALEELGVRLSGDTPQQAPSLNIHVSKTITPLTASEASYTVRTDELPTVGD